MYETAKEKFIKARKETNLAKVDKQQAEVELTNKIEGLPEAYESMVNAMAQAQAGELSKPKATKAEKDYQAKKDEVQNLKTALDVKTKLVPIRMKQERKALLELKEASKGHFKTKAQPLINDVVASFDSLNDTINKLAELKRELSSLGLHTGSFIPTSLNFTIQTDKRTPLSVTDYLTQIETLKAE